MTRRTRKLLSLALTMLALCVPVMGADHNAPANRAAEGSISIQAVQGTEGGPQIGAEDAVVELIRADEGNSQPQRIPVKLDSHGAGLLENVPLQSPFQPRVLVRHAGVWFDAVGKPMDAANPTQTITVAVYETTQEPPKWEIQRRSLRMLPSPDGLDVAEMLELCNPSDRAYLGAADAHGERSWIVLPLPAGAMDAVPSNGLGVVDGKLVSLVPLNPGPTIFAVNYKLPAKDGRATLDLAAPVRVTSTMLFLPDDNTTLQAQGAQSAGMYSMETPMRGFEAPAQEPGQRLLVTVGNLGKDSRSLLADDVPSSSVLPRTVAAIGGGAILVFCIVLLVIRPRKNNQETPAP